MPVKKAQKVKKARAPRAPRSPSETTKKKSQKLKQVQKVNVNVTSGGGGGTSAPAPFIPQQFRDTSGENIRLENIIKSVTDNLARGNILGRAPAPVFAAPEVAPNPANDSATTNAVFNAPINNTQSLPEIILGATETITPVKRKKIPALPTPTPSTEKQRKERADKGLARGSIKEKAYLEGLMQGTEQGIDIGVPTGRDIQNKAVMDIEQMQSRALQPGQLRMVPTAEEQPASSSFSDINFA